MIKLQDYEKLYFQLFNKITDVIEELQDVQRQVEDAYIGMNSKNDATPPLLFYPGKDKRDSARRDRADCR